MAEIGTVYRKHDLNAPVAKKTHLPMPMPKGEVKEHVTNQIAEASRMCSTLYGPVSNNFPYCQITAALRDGKNGKISEAKAVV